MRRRRSGAHAGPMITDYDTIRVLVDERRSDLRRAATPRSRDRRSRRSSLRRWRGADRSLGHAIPA